MIEVINCNYDYVYVCDYNHLNFYDITDKDNDYDYDTDYGTDNDNS